MALVALCLVLILWWHPILVHLSQETGTTNSASRAYDFWSGFGSDIGEIVLIGGAWSLIRRHNCGVKGCWRIGRHPVAAGTVNVCRHHHPDLAGRQLTVELVHTLHHLHRYGGAVPGQPPTAPPDRRRPWGSRLGATRRHL